MKILCSICFIYALNTTVFSQSDNGFDCLTESCWFYGQQGIYGYMPPDMVFTFNTDGTFVMNNYVTGNSHGGNWQLLNSMEVYLKYTTTTATKLNSDITITLNNCSSFMVGATPYKRMDSVNFIDSQIILQPDGTPWEIYCKGVLLN